jgi:hypothetical protein
MYFFALCYFLNASGLLGWRFNPDCHVRAHLTAQRTPSAGVFVDYFRIVVPGLVKQLGHSDIAQRTLGHAKTTPLTSLAINCYIRHKTPKADLSPICWDM